MSTTGNTQSNPSKLYPSNRDPKLKTDPKLFLHAAGKAEDLIGHAEDRDRKSVIKRSTPDRQGRIGKARPQSKAPLDRLKRNHEDAVLVIEM